MLDNHSSRAGINSALIFIVLSIVAISLFWQRLPNEIPLFYSRPWGEDQIGKPLMLFLLPISSFVILCANIITVKFLKADFVLIKIMVWVAALFSFLAFITLLRIIILVV